jgi:2-oxoglutarate ferredoxin oxidoreductase subunit beta
LEIYQNCNIFNDGAFFTFTEKESKPDSVLFLENGQPLVYGSEMDKGILLDGCTPKMVSLKDGQYSKDDLWVHDENDIYKAQILARFFDDPATNPNAFPRPFGVFYQTDRPCYEDMLLAQVEAATEQLGEGDLDALIAGRNIWEIK